MTILPGPLDKLYNSSKQGALLDVSRCDIEQEIMEIGNFASILKNYADMVYDGQWTSSSQDDIHTTLHGFAHLLDAHADKMMLSHNKHYRLNEWVTDKQKERRGDYFEGS